MPVKFSKSFKQMDKVTKRVTVVQIISKTTQKKNCSIISTVTVENLK